MGSVISSEEDSESQSSAQTSEDDEQGPTGQTVDSRQPCQRNEETEVSKQNDAPINDVKQQSTNMTAGQHLSETSGSLICKPTSDCTSGTVENPPITRRAVAWEIDVSDLGARRQADKGSRVNLNSYLEGQTFEPVKATVQDLMQRKVFDQRRWSVTCNGNRQTDTKANGQTLRQTTG
jgi:hypothetical protein